MDDKIILSAPEGGYRYSDGDEIHLVFGHSFKPFGEFEIAAPETGAMIALTHPRTNLVADLRVVDGQWVLTVGPAKKFEVKMVTTIRRAREE